MKVHKVTPVRDVARALSDGLWDEATEYLAALAGHPVRVPDPNVLVGWLGGVVAQGLGPGELGELQLPEPFAGYGGTDGTPRLLVVGLNPGLSRDQYFPRWDWHRSPHGRDAYFDFFWQGFSSANRDGAGRPLKWNANRTKSTPIPHYRRVEDVVTPNALASVAWQVDAIPWKSSFGVDRREPGRILDRTEGRLVIPEHRAQWVARSRVKMALAAIHPVNGSRHVLVLGPETVGLLGLASAPLHQWKLVPRGPDRGSERG